jgi:hypothetical protein
MTSGCCGGLSGPEIREAGGYRLLCWLSSLTLEHRYTMFAVQPLALQRAKHRDQHVQDHRQKQRVWTSKTCGNGVDAVIIRQYRAVSPLRDSCPLASG